MMRLLIAFLLLTVACSPKTTRTIDISPVVPVAAPAGGNEALQNGPMLGYVELREALIWVQTKSYAAVQVEYWERDKPGQKWRTDVVQTYKQSAFTAKCIAQSLEPGVTYDYRVEINGDSVLLPYPTFFRTQPLWQWRTDPPAFTLATGSCAYVNEDPYDRPGKPYGSNHRIYTQMTAQKPDLMLWLGDNVYLREVDWYTRAGIQHRYTHDRSATPEMHPLLASTPQYAIWDDHDYGPDDSDATWVHKETAWEVFRDFWGNPSFGVNGQKGCTTKFQFADVDFFLLDNRYFRTPNFCKTCPRTLLGKEQLDWFLAALAASRAPYKIVAIGGQMLSTSMNNETAMRFFPAERDTILKFIERENIKGVIFLTGDRHFTELSALQNAAGNWVYDFTASPLTSGVYADAPVKEKNEYRIPGTAVGEHNFGLLRFSGPRTQREVEIRVINAEGKELWTRRLTQEGMKE